MDLFHSRAGIEGSVMRLGAKMSFNLPFGGLEAFLKPLGMSVSIRLQPTEVLANSAPNFRLSTGKPGGHAFYVLWGIDVSADFDLDLSIGTDFPLDDLMRTFPPLNN